MQIYVSKLKAAKIFIPSFAGTIASLFLSWKIYEWFAFWLQRDTDFPWVGAIFQVIYGLIFLLGILFFGSAAVIFGKRIFDEKPQLIISHEGIEDKRLKLGVIKWDEISSIFSHKFNPADRLILNLVTPENYYEKLPVFVKLMRKINGESSLNSFKIYFTELDKSMDEAFDYILDIKFDNVICKKL